MSKNKKILVMSLVAVILFGSIYVFATLSSGTGNNENRDQATNMRNVMPIETVKVSEIKNTISSSGYVEKNETFYVYPETSSKVLEMKVEEGDIINKGDVILTYDNQDTLISLNRQLEENLISLENSKLQLNTIYSTNNSVDQAKDNLESLKIDYENKLDDLELAQQETETYKNFYESGIETKVVYDAKIQEEERIVQELESIQRNIDTAEKNIISSSENLGNSYTQQQNSIKLTELKIEEIRYEISKLTEFLSSPYTGTVTLINATEGSTTNLGSAVLEIVDYTNLIVSSEVSEYDIYDMYVGQKVEMYSDARPEVKYYGEITYIGDEAYSGSGVENVVRVETSIDNVDEYLKVGFSLNIDIIVSDLEDILTVSTVAVQTDNETNENYVYLLKDNETIVKQIVETGDKSNTEIQIVSGLSQSDRVINKYFNYIEDDMTVTDLMEIVSNNEDTVQSNSTEERTSEGVDLLTPSIPSGGTGRPSGVGGGGRP